MALKFEVSRQFRSVLGGLSLEALERTLSSLWGRLAPDAPEPEMLEISLSAADSEGMRELNKRYRGIDEPTDVLSFPLWETTDGLFSPPSGWPVLGLGDVVVCPPEIAGNADRCGKKYEDELLLVLVHGVLHLFARDHRSEEDKIGMWKIQEDLVKAYRAKTAPAPGEKE
ncbi:MAG: rRNA maturation RNase YbeY [Thermovirgaceae bacterium]